MTIGENVPLAPLTTFGVGGVARFFAEARTEKDIMKAVAFAAQHGLSLFALGNGSNVLVPDNGIEGLVLKISLRDSVAEESNGVVHLRAGAGTSWDAVVDKACARDAFGIENLAGIPGTLGGAAVQNIGAYGVDLSAVFEYADGIDASTNSPRRISLEEAAFGYRTSYFKRHPDFIIATVALRLKKHGAVQIAYADLARAQAEGVPLTTPREVADAVRAIRAVKFPHSENEGTAGSFFKNPVVFREQAEALTAKFPGLPTFPQKNGDVKLSLAWILDHALSLKGYSFGPVRLFEKQPLVIVAKRGATAADVDAFAADVANRVFSATGIAIEREVETFGAQK
ncbi:MAG: UDP-N-acetylmuramate dehydrogenase [Minisyncoccia bacterium]